MDEESVSRARWRYVDDELRRIEQADGLLQPPKPKGGGMPPDSNQSLIDGLHAAIHEEGEATREEIHQLGGRVQQLSDNADADRDRITRTERRLDSIHSPVKSILLGLVGLLIWFGVWYGVKLYFGENLTVIIDGKDVMLKDHPKFGDLTTAILGAGLVFILVTTIFNVIMDFVTNRRPKARPERSQGQDEEVVEDGDEPSAQEANSTDPTSEEEVPDWVSSEERSRVHAV